MAGNKTMFITVGKIGAPYGVRGWVKIHSFTESVENLLDYDPWYLPRFSQLKKAQLKKAQSEKTQSSETPEWVETAVFEAKIHGKGIIAKFEGCDDRDAAAHMRGLEIAVRRDQLPEPEAGEYYWVDLEGLEVITLDGISLGRIDHMLETGANDVMVVKGDRERLIPYVPGPIVHEVDIEGGTIRVDWDPSYE
jgi:16S rRNA processing protein RimM